MGCAAHWHHPFRDSSRSAGRHREGIQDYDARTVPAATHPHGLFAVAAQCLEGCGIPAQARLLEGYQPYVSRGPWSVVLLAQHCHGLPLHLCQLFQARDPSAVLRRTDSHHRFTGSHPRRTYHLSCCPLGGCAARQRSLAHLHHPAQCLRAGIRFYACHGIYREHHVLSAVDNCRPYLQHLHSRSQHFVSQ